MADALPVIAVTGLLAEARIAAGEGVLAVAGGGDATRLALALDAALAGGARAVISFGIAGGLAQGLKPGVVVVARAVGDGRRRYECDPRWTKRLVAALPHAIVADVAGVDAAVGGRDAKAAMREATGAVAVDMESHVAARLAARHGVPFAALRVLADPAERSLPRAAIVGMRPDGSTDVGAVLRALGRDPSELPALVRTALDARAAFSALAKARRRLGPLLGFSPRRSNERDGLFGLTPPIEPSAFSASGGSGMELPKESA